MTIHLDINKVNGTQISQQLTFDDYLVSLRDQLVSDLEEWRDAQYDSDLHKAFVDDVFTALIHEVERGIMPF